MGTKTYGRDTGAGFCTLQELRFIINERKPFFLIKMCDRFEEAETRFRLDSSISFFPWTCGTEMRPSLVDDILTKLRSVGGGGLVSPATPRSDGAVFDSRSSSSLATSASVAPGCVYLSYASGFSEIDRYVRSRVTRINELLQRRGFRTWFDVEQVSAGSNVRRTISDGMSRASCILAFISETYERKVNSGGGGAGDDCFYEFTLASLQHSGRIIPLIMEDGLLNTRNWSRGRLFEELGDVMFVSLCDNEDTLSERGLNDLIKSLVRFSGSAPAVPPVLPVIRMRPLAPSLSAHVYLAHTFSYDQLGRDNHARVKRINNILQRMGFITWFDEDKLRAGDNIKDAIRGGVVSAGCVAVRITKAFETRVNQPVQNGYIGFEFDVVSEYHMRSRIPVIMEECMLVPDYWDSYGRVHTELTDQTFNGVYVDLTEDNPTIFEENVRILASRIERVISENYI
jgi:hypothetical protein